MSTDETLTALVRGTPSSELPALAGELARALATVVARSAADAATVSTRVERPAGELLNIEEAAARLNVEVSWLYRHARDLPFSRKLGRRTLRFDACGLERWAAIRPKV